MDRRTIIKSLGLAAAALAITGTSALAQQVLRFSHTDNPGGSRDQAAQLFASKVAEYSEGRLKVQVYPSGQLANDPKAIEQLQLGGVDFTVSATGSYATHLASLNLTATNRAGIFTTTPTGCAVNSRSCPKRGSASFRHGRRVSAASRPPSRSRRPKRRRA